MNNKKEIKVLPYNENLKLNHPVYYLEDEEIKKLCANVTDEKSPLFYLKSDLSNSEQELYQPLIISLKDIKSLDIKEDIKIFNPEKNKKKFGFLERILPTKEIIFVDKDVEVLPYDNTTKRLNYDLYYLEGNQMKFAYFIPTSLKEANLFYLKKDLSSLEQQKYDNKFIPLEMIMLGNGEKQLKKVRR